MHIMDVEYVLVGLLTGAARRSQLDLDVLAFPRPQKVIAGPKSPIGLNHILAHHPVTIDNTEVKDTALPPSSILI